jgi:hypothetical protein
LLTGLGFALLVGLYFVLRPQQYPDHWVHLSMIRLIATPERYDGKLVSVRGFLFVDAVHEPVLFLSKVDQEQWKFEQAVVLTSFADDGVLFDARATNGEQPGSWKLLGPLSRDAVKPFSLQYVRVIGTFCPGHTGVLPPAEVDSPALCDVRQVRVDDEVPHSR